MKTLKQKIEKINKEKENIPLEFNENGKLAESSRLKFYRQIGKLIQIKNIIKPCEGCKFALYCKVSKRPCKDLRENEI